MKKCNECHCVNNSDANYCRRCGAKIKRNILEQYPKMKLVPTNFYDWRKPKVGIFLKCVLFIPIVIDIFIICFSIWSLFYYNQQEIESESEYQTYVEDSFGGFILWADGYGNAYKWNNTWYESRHWYGDDSEGNEVWEYEGEVEDPVLYTTSIALRTYKKHIIYGGIYCLVILAILFVFRNYIVCGYIKRPKDVRHLSFYADYVQKYFYLGIFRKKKLPNSFFL